MTAAKPAARRPRSAPEEVWAAVRRDYLDGLSAVDCCRRYGVRMATLRDRAARQGWRRIDQPWVPPTQLDSQDEGVQLDERTGGDLDRVALRELSFVAHRRMMRAALRGDAAEALRWRRVRMAMDAEEEEVQRFLSREETLLSMRDDAEPDSPDSLDGVLSLDKPDPARAGTAEDQESPKPEIRGSVAV